MLDATMQRRNGPILTIAHLKGLRTRRDGQRARPMSRRASVGRLPNGIAGETSVGGKRETSTKGLPSTQSNPTISWREQIRVRRGNKTKEWSNTHNSSFEGIENASRQSTSTSNVASS